MLTSVSVSDQSFVLFLVIDALIWLPGETFPRVTGGAG